MLDVNKKSQEYRNYLLDGTILLNMTAVVDETAQENPAEN